jgi:hypothetical protein
MATRTIRTAQFMYYIPTGRTRRRRDGVEEDILSVRHALRGDTVDIPRDEDIARGERAGTFVPDEVEQASPVETQEEATGLDFSSHDALVGWIKSEQPTVHTVVDAADDDPDKAQMLLAAEEEATGGQPRKGVVTALNRIVHEAEEDEEDE